MRVRRLLPAQALLRLPLDSRDMFILSCLEEPMGVGELADISPLGTEQCMERVRTLVEQGALELVFDEEAEAFDDGRALRAGKPPRRPSSELRPVADAAHTGVRMRPEQDLKSRTRVLIGAITLGRRRPSVAIEEPLSDAAVGSSPLLPAR